MGWSFFDNYTRKEMIQHLTEPQEWDSENKQVKCKRTCLAKQYKGSAFAGTLYAVFEDERTHVDGTVKTSRWIFVALLRYSNYQNSRSWGYKDMEETMGPNAVGCPEKYFQMVPEPDHPSARGWRKRCRLHREEVSVKMYLNKMLRAGKMRIEEAQKEFDDVRKAISAQYAIIREESDKDYEQWSAKEAERRAKEEGSKVELQTA